MKNKVLKKVIDIVPIIFIIGLSIALIYSVFYIEKLEEQIRERDKTIQELSFRSDLVEEYFDIKHDSLEHTTSYSLKGTKANFTIMQQDSTELLFLQGDKVFTVRELVKEYNALVSNYNRLACDYDNLVGEFNSEYNKNMHRIRDLETVLGMIEKRYCIQYNISRDSTFSVIYLSNTEKIDSALMLLPYYKDKLKKVSDSVWTIEYIESK